MSQRNQSKFVTDGVVDDPLQQSGGFKMDADDRQFIDNQIRGIQKHIIDNPASVAVTALGAAPLVVVKDVALGAVRHRTIKVTGDKSGEQDPAGFDGEIHIRPVPPGHANPNDTGAKADAATARSRTGSGTAGSTTLTVSSAAGLAIGDKILIDTVTGGPRLIDNIVGTAITLHTAITTAGSVPVVSERVVVVAEDGFATTFTAMSSTGNRAQKMVAEGQYYFGAGLTLTQTAVLQGSGCQQAIGDDAPSVPGNRSWPGTMFAFPLNKTGIRVKSTQASEVGGVVTTAATTSGSASVTFADVTGIAAGQDILIAGVTGNKHINTLVGSVGTLSTTCDATVAAGAVAIVTHTSSADRSVISDLTLHCKDAATTIGEGIYTTAQVRVQNVIIDGFGGDGFKATGTLNGTDGNADGCVLDNVQAVSNKGWGYHFEGNDAQVGALVGCSALNNVAGGFRDLTRGNTYIGCHSEGNTGPDYKIGFGGSGSTLVGCYTEGDNAQIESGTLILGGGLAGRPTGIGGYNLGFSISTFGHVDAAPLVYVNSYGPNYVRCNFGGPVNDATMQMFGWEVWSAGAFPTPGTKEDTSTLCYLGDASPWVSLQNGSSYREVLRFPTQFGGALRAAVWAPEGVFFGKRTETPVALTMESAIPDRNPNTNQPITHEVGYTILNKAPAQGAALGWRCLTAGTLDGAAFVSTNVATTSGSTAVTFSAVSGVAVGQYFTIAGVTGTKRLVSLSGSSGVIDSVASATVAAGALAYVAPTFETFGADLAQPATNTTDATVTRVRRVPVADGHVRRLNWIVTCRSTDNSGAVLGEWEIKASYKRIAGVLSTSYAATITNTFAVGGPTGGPSLSMNGSTDVDLSVTGIAATNLTWEVSEFAL